MATKDGRRGTACRRLRVGAASLVIGEERGTRDRDGSFEPQIVRKRQRRFEGFDDKILALYARGMSTGV
jgi:putative transposase